ncbi:MAG TPA: thiamine pyrophosphate-dependent dehydrogenase E1 component subunit alpha [Acidobacteriota bacterium]|nr:thiamine pyrophosphate-dependent dehydrogenase E1 component subunit alpha [Acidobacteriota bacterium]
MPADLWALYELMLRSRLVEEAVAGLWRRGLISGEMHLGTGEEAISAGVVSHLREGDAMALDHRGTPPLVMRGVDPVAIVRELLGRPDGLCRGQGGHMHLFSPDHLAASSGIVGASGPAAAGFALAAKLLRPGSVAVAFFGEGAMNQGMLMESLNLAAVWGLPALFVCKDDGWSITARSETMTGGSLDDRARGLGLPAFAADGLDAAAVWEATEPAIRRARDGGGPTFLRFRSVHLEGHFLGFQLLRAVRQPLKEMPAIALALAKSLLAAGGARAGDRLASLKDTAAAILATLRDPRRESATDPVARARRTLASEAARLDELEAKLAREAAEVVAAALAEAPG